MNVSGVVSAPAETEPADPPVQEGAEPTEADAAYRAALASIRAHEYDQALKKLEEAVTQKTTYMAEVGRGPPSSRAHTP